MTISQIRTVETDGTIRITEIAGGIPTTFFDPPADAAGVLTNDGVGGLSWEGAGPASVDWGDVGGTLANQTDLQTALNAKQALDTDLTTIAGLTATTDNFMVAASSAWASRTPAQAKTSLALVKGDVGLGNVDNTTDAGKPVSTATQTALDAKADDLGADDNYVTDAEKTKLAALSGTNSGDQILPTDATIVTTDVTTNNATTGKHGWLQKLPGDTATWLRADGTWTAPVAVAGLGNSRTASANVDLAADFGAVLTRKYTIASGIKFSIASGAIFRIL